MCAACQDLIARVVLQVTERGVACVVTGGRGREKRSVITFFVCVCVCVREREREKKRKKVKDKDKGRDFYDKPSILRYQNKKKRTRRKIKLTFTTTCKSIQNIRKKKNTEKKKK